MITLTFDTDVLRDYLCPSREHHAHAKALVPLDEQKICEIRVVSRFAADVPGGVLRHRADKSEIGQRPRIGTFAQWDISDWDADFWASEEDEEICSKLFNLIFPGSDPVSKRHKNRIADIGHLIGHMRSNRDIFVTRDTAMLSQAPALLANFGISVMNPAEALELCRPK